MGIHNDVTLRGVIRDWKRQSVLQDVEKVRCFNLFEMCVTSFFDFHENIQTVPQAFCVYLRLNPEVFWDASPIAASMYSQLSEMKVIWNGVCRAENEENRDSILLQFQLKVFF